MTGKEPDARTTPDRRRVVVPTDTERRRAGERRRGKRGRPRLDDADASVHVGVTLPSKQFDAYSRRALREQVSVPEIIRRDLGVEKKSTK